MAGTRETLSPRESGIGREEFFVFSYYPNGENNFENGLSLHAAYTTL